MIVTFFVVRGDRHKERGWLWPRRGDVAGACALHAAARHGTQGAGRLDGKGSHFAEGKSKDGFSQDQTCK